LLAGGHSAVALARRELATIVDLYRRSLREPPPLYLRTALAWAEAARASGDPVTAAARSWESAPNAPRENAEPEHELVLGGRRTFAEITAESARGDESGAEWFDSEPSRLGRWARGLFDPMLAHERLEDR
jgi:exonuclease V gamma subunit